MLDVAKSTAKVLYAQAPRASVEVTKTVADWFHDSVLRGRNEIYSEVVTLTPDMAKLLLSGNENNRPVSPNKLAEIKADIQDGRFELNGESLKVATDGTLNDGQHRCWAVVETGIAIPTLVTFGLNRDSRMTVDQQQPRTAAQYLQMEANGVKYAKTVAAAARVLLVNKLGYRSDVGAWAGVTRSAVRREYIQNQRELDLAAYFCCGKFNQKVLGGGAVATAALVLARRISPSADDFFEGFIKGTDLSEGDPVLTLRNKFIATPGIKQMDKLRMILRAFDAWSNDQTLLRLQIKPRKAFKARGK